MVKTTYVAVVAATWRRRHGVGGHRVHLSPGEYRSGSSRGEHGARRSGGTVTRRGGTSAG